MLCLESKNQNGFMGFWQNIGWNLSEGPY